MKKIFAGRAALDPRLFWSLFVAVCLFGLALRLPTLTSRSLWLDETYSAWFSSLPLHELWTSVPLYETHPPMYYTLLKAWRTIFGSSEGDLRSLSVAVSVATIMLVALAGKILRAGATGDKVALMAALFLAVNSGNIEYAQQARPYAMEALFATLAILFSLVLLRKIVEAGDQPLRQQRLGATICALGLCAGATLWLHNTAIFIAFGIWTGLILSLLIFARGNRWMQALAIAIPGVIALLIWSPFVPMLMKESANMSKMSFWVAFNRKDIMSAWYLAAGGQRPFFPIALLSLAGVVVLWRKERHSLFHLITIMLLPLGVMLVYSYFVKPIFISRLFEWLSPSLMVLAAIGVMVGLRHVYWRVGAALIVVAISLISTRQFYQKPTENWRAIVTSISVNSQPGDVLIVLPNEANVPLHYYIAGRPFPDVQYIPAPFPALGLNYKYIGNLGAPAVIPEDGNLVRTVASTHKRVWLLTRKADIYDPQGIIRGAVVANRKLVASYGREGIVVDLFE